MHPLSLKFEQTIGDVNGCCIKVWGFFPLNPLCINNYEPPPKKKIPKASILVLNYL